MTLASHAVMPLADGNTNMSEGGLIVLSICAMFLMGCLLLPPILAGRAPRHREPASVPSWTPVQGGVHIGEGRSVAPHRDAPAESAEDQVTPAPGAQTRAVHTDSGQEHGGTEEG